jgi:zinc protease
MGSIMKNQAVNPQYIFTQKIANTLVKSPKGQAISIEAIEGAKREDVLSIAHNATANAADYTFFFVGNVDTESLRPLVERYIASLPGNAKKAVKTITPDASMEIAAGTSTNTFTTAMETPQTWVAIFANGNVPYTDKNKRSASAAGQILTKRLLDTVREREGAVYSISAAGNLNRAGLYPAIIQTAFPMKPEMKDKVLGMIRQEFTDMCSNVTDEELDKVKEFMVKTITENREQNQSWVSAMQSAAINGVDTFNNAMETVNSLTTADVMNFMREVLSQGNYQVIVLDPAEETEETEE